MSSTIRWRGCSVSFELKPISASAIPEALGKVERYRLLNEPLEAQSICEDILRIDPDLERAQVERLRALRGRRDPAAWSATLDALEQRARSGANVMPAMIDAVLAWATVGEIAGRLRSVFGEHRETLVL